MIISERLFKIMKKKHVSQYELANITGIGQSTISDWKTKKTNPSADKLMKICDALDISIEELLQDTMTKKQKREWKNK